MIKRWFFRLALLLSSSIVQGVGAGGCNADGNVYYMSTSGSDSSGDGSINNPWTTLEYSQVRLRPGDTLYIRGGVYHNQRVHHDFVSGTEECRIAISGYPGESAIFDGGKTTKGFLYDLSDSSYVTLRNLEIRNYPVQLINLLDNCNYWIFEDLYIHDIGTPDMWDGNSFVSGIIISNGHHNIIRHNRGENIGARASQHHWIYFNVNAEYNEVYNNYFSGAYAAALHSWHVPAGSHNKFHHNIIVNNRQWGWVNGNGEEYDEFHHNTLYDNGYFTLDIRAPTNILRDNIIYWFGSENKVVSGNEFDGNCWYPDSGLRSSTGVVNDPLFVDPLNGDFHLRSGSPCVGKGAYETGNEIIGPREYLITPADF